MNEKQPNFIQNAYQALVNLVESRTQFFRNWIRPGRNIDDECGHPLTIDILELKRAFLRNDVARRVVTLYPEESWETPPEIYETEDETKTEFEKAWELLDRRLSLNAFFLRADVLAGIGRFGIILLGIDDGSDLSQAVPGVVVPKPGDASTPPVQPPGRQLLYVRCFDETFVTIKTLNADATNPRFGLPEIYTIEFSAEQMQGNIQTVSAGTGGATLPISPGAGATTRRDVHWTRVIHLADNRLNNEILGSPRMEIVFNRLLDLSKITGGSAEMFWKGGFPGISIEAPIPADGTPVHLDKEETREQMEKYMSGLQRFLGLVGAQAKSLAVQVADPEPHVRTQLQMIAIALGCPLRVFMGSEQAQLASGQDIISWNDRMMRRRDTYITPFILRPFIERLQMAGILPQVGEDGVQIEWDDMNAIERASQRATYAMNQTTALTGYLSSGGDQLIPPFEFLTLIMGMTDDEARACINEAGDRLISTDPVQEHQNALDMIQAKAAAAAQAPGGRAFQNNHVHASGR